MNKQDKKQLRRFIFTLYITPIVKLNLLYFAYRWYYWSNYLGISSKLADHIPNEIDRQIVEPYLTAISNCGKQDFITIYAAVCKVLKERTN